MIVEQEGGFGKGSILLFCSHIFMPIPVHAEILYLFRLVEQQIGCCLCFLLKTRISYYSTVTRIPGFCKSVSLLIVYSFFLVIPL